MFYETGCKEAINDIKWESDGGGGGAGGVSLCTRLILKIQMHIPLFKFLAGRNYICPILVYGTRRARLLKESSLSFLLLAME